MAIFHVVSKSQIFLSVLLGVVAMTGDLLLKVVHNDIYRALCDSVTHGVIGGLSWLIVAAHYDFKHGILDAFLCALISSGIDVDHFIAAHSFNIKDAVKLPSRPFLHSTSFTLTSCIAMILLINSIQLSATLHANLQRIVWLCVIAILSHHIRDGNRRGLWLWPLPFGSKFKPYSTPPIPKGLYIGLIISLPHIFALLFLPYSGDISLHKGFVNVV